MESKEIKEKQRVKGDKKRFLRKGKREGNKWLKRRANWGFAGN
jgi:hypothetical protein